MTKNEYTITLISLLLVFIICSILFAMYYSEITRFLEGLGRGLSYLYVGFFKSESVKISAGSFEVEGGNPPVDSSVSEATDSSSGFGLLTNQRITAYTIRPEEGTNCESASGINLCGDVMDLSRFDFEGIVVGVVACPKKYPFGTIVGIEKTLEGGLSYYSPHMCVDRMNAYHREMGHWDILIQGENKVQRAKDFGVQYLEIKIYK